MHVHFKTIEEGEEKGEEAKKKKTFYFFHSKEICTPKVAKQLKKCTVQKDKKLYYSSVLK